MQMTKNLTIEFYPASFIQLRKELSTAHEDLWAKVGYFMAFDQMEFILKMNEELNCVCLPEQGIDVVCKKYLTALRSRKGRAATKSFELLAAERNGLISTNIFGTADEAGEREVLHNWKVKKEKLQ